MARKKQFIGVDLHHNNFVACFLNKDQLSFSCKYDLNADGFKSFLSMVSKRDAIAVEATTNVSFFADKVAAHVAEVVPIHAYAFRVIATSAKKTDAHDAYNLALFLEKGMLPKARLKPFTHAQILSLLTTRQLFVRNKVALNRKAYGILIRNGIKVPKRKLEYPTGYQRFVFCNDLPDEVLFELNVIHASVSNTQEQIKKIEVELEDLCSEIDDYHIIRSIPGMGPVNSAIMLAVIVDAKHFETFPRLASYFGIVPRIRLSNDKKNTGKITRRGSKLGRSALVQSTWIAIQRSSYLKNYYERQKINKGAAQKAIVATANKYLKIIYECMKDEILYENYVAQFEKKAE